MINDKGEVYQIGGFVRDIHESKLQNARYQNLFEAIDKTAIISITDLNGKIAYINEKFSQISGYTAEDLIGKDHRVVNSGYHPKDFIKKMWSTLDRGNGSWQGEIRNKRKDGTYYWVNSSIVPFMWNGKNAYLSVRFDITEQKESQRKLIESSKMSSLGEMAGGIAHEINNPLTIISGKASGLKRSIQSGNFDAPKVIEGLSKIEMTTKRIAKIISGLYAYSRDADHDPMSLARASVIVGDTLVFCLERFRSQGVTLNVNCPESIEVECRATQISQVLINLLSNAYDAIEGQSEKWVSINVISENDFVKISIIDSGPGISEKVAERIMDPFFTTKPVGKGTGLGLSIAKGIVESHHGYFTYNSAVKNTTFELKLPLRQPSKNSSVNSVN